MSTGETQSVLQLLNEMDKKRRALMKTFGPAILGGLLASLLALYFVEPPPPKELTIAAGPQNGNYYAIAQQYASFFAESGIQLNVRETAGSIENYDLLLHDDSVDLAIVQGGTVPEDESVSSLESLATLYPEPLWIFYRTGLTIQKIEDLQGLRIAIGADGSGTQALATLLLGLNGVINGEAETRLMANGGNEAETMLRDGEIDAAFFVTSARSERIHKLLKDTSIRLLNIDRSRAYAQRYPFLTDIVLAEGVIHFEDNLPRQDVQLIAPFANLVATHQLHDALIPLLVQAAIQTHERGGLVTEPGSLPSLVGSEFPPNEVARHSLKYGPPFFQKYLGFWLTSLIDRTKIMLVPLIVLVVPLAKLAPPVYRWRIRSRIYRWYALLRSIDQSLRADSDANLDRYIEQLKAVEQELVEVTVPLSYMEEFYHLRLHIDLVQRRLDERRSASTN